MDSSAIGDTIILLLSLIYIKNILIVTYQAFARNVWVPGAKETQETCGQNLQGINIMHLSVLCQGGTRQM